MKERPILFSGPMVRAILDGRKTQTRRIVRAEHVEGIEIEDEDMDRFAFMHAPTCGGFCDYACAASGETFQNHIGWTPWGSNPMNWGRLWVRESFCQTFDTPAICDYKATPIHNVAGIYPWKPSIHMPRWASRLTLEITGVRVERLQDISLDDARAEGIPQMHQEAFRQGLCAGSEAAIDQWDNATSVENFSQLWDTINGKRAAWSSNPWVWVVEFQRVAP